MNDNDDYNSKRTIEYMKKNMLNRKKKSIYKFPLTGISIMSELVKKQNLKLLTEIANDKFYDEEDKKNFVNKYLKVNYYSPEKTNIKKENLQKYI